MDDKPPRRSRRPQNKRSNDSSFPLIPFLIGVIVLGFVIGAGFSMAGRRGGSSGDVADTASAAPTITPTFAPATFAPLATPRPISSTADATDDPSDAPDSAAPDSPTPEATATHKPSPKPSPSPRVALATLPASSESATPVAKPTATPTKSTLLASPVTPVPIHPHVVATKTPTPSPVVTSAATATPAPVAHVAAATAVPATTVDADTDFGRLSANVVQQYLRALKRGDTESAYGAFGVAPGSGGVAFPEQTAMQAPGQIVNVQARGNNDTQYVTVDISTPTGTYYATYGVRHTSTGAAIITTHSISKQ